MISRLGRLQEIRGNVFWQLILLSPLLNIFIIAASVLCVEVDKWLRMLWKQPNLAEDADINCAHELLSEDVKTVC